MMKPICEETVGTLAREGYGGIDPIQVITPDPIIIYEGGAGLISPKPTV